MRTELYKFTSNNQIVRHIHFLNYFLIIHFESFTSQKHYVQLHFLYVEKTFHVVQNVCRRNQQFPDFRMEWHSRFLYLTISLTWFLFVEIFGNHGAEKEIWITWRNEFEIQFYSVTLDEWTQVHRELKMTTFPIYEDFFIYYFFITFIYIIDMYISSIKKGHSSIILT